jgi:hypothetical protein
MQKTILDDLIAKNELIKKLKLTTSINTSNMHVFDEDCKIIKISCPEEIIFRFYHVRKSHFTKRKKDLIDTLSSELGVLESKVKFIKYVISEKIVVFNKKKDFIIKQIEKFDDISFKTKGWVNDCIKVLQANKDIGLTGPLNNNNKILTQSFVSRKHYELFGFYFPEEIINWYCDDWINIVYKKLYVFIAISTVSFSNDRSDPKEGVTANATEQDEEGLALSGARRVHRQPRGAVSQVTMDRADSGQDPLHRNKPQLRSPAAGAERHFKDF